MTTTPVPVDLVGITESLPWLVGFEPRESLLVLAARDRLLGTIGRADITGDPDHDAAAWAHILRTTALRSTEPMIVVAWTNDPARAGSALTVAVGAQIAGFPIDIALTVTDERISGTDLRPGGHTFDLPRDRTSADPIAAEMIGAGLTIVRDRYELAGQYAAADTAVLADPTAGPDRVRTAWRALLNDESVAVDDMTPAEIATLGAIGRFGPIGDDVAMTLWPDQHDDPQAVERPDQNARGERLRALARRLTAHPSNAAALTLVAVHEFATGNGARANIALDRALEADPGHKMAHLLGDMLTAGVNPTRRS